jgi:hypothetical protein
VAANAPRELSRGDDRQPRASEAPPSVTGLDLVQWFIHKIEITIQTLFASVAFESNTHARADESQNKNGWTTFTHSRAHPKLVNSISMTSATPVPQDPGGTIERCKMQARGKANDTRESFSADKVGEAS